MIRPYLDDMIIDHKIQGECKIQITMSISSISSNDSDETHNLRTKSNNVEIMMGDETDEIMDELFNIFHKIIKKF